MGVSVIPVEVAPLVHLQSDSDDDRSVHILGFLDMASEGRGIDEHSEG